MIIVHKKWNENNETKETFYPHMHVNPSPPKKNPKNPVNLLSSVYTNA